MMATLFVALFVGHWLGDHWIQTDHQAQIKGAHSRGGRRACLAHVATLTLGQIVALAVVVLYAEATIALINLVIGLAINAASHYWCDRRHTLEGLAYALHRSGKHDYYRLGGAPALDQAFHMLFLLLSAVIMAAPDATALVGSTGLALAVLAMCMLLSRMGRDLKPGLDAQQTSLD